MANFHDSIGFTPFEPKVKNRYVFSITDAGQNVQGLDAYLIKTAARPQIEFEEITLEHLNLKRYVKGKATWQPISITLYDPIVPSAAQAVMQWIIKSHNALTGADGYAQQYKRNCTIQTLGPAGDIVEQWDLFGTWIQSANFNDLDFTSNDPVDIELSLRYDYANLVY